MKSLQHLIHQSILRRQHLSAVTNAVRLVNGAGDGLEGLLIDRYHQHLHVQLLSDAWHTEQENICRVLQKAMPIDYLIVKSRQGMDIKAEILIGADPCTVVQEYGIKFAVNLNDGLNSGLFLDMRHNRHLVAQQTRGRKVFNGFSYTCSFGLHARMNGAAEIVNTDISRKILERGKNNYQLNGLDAAPGEFAQIDTVSYLMWALKKNNSFDMVVIDPPSFARHEGKTFQVKRDMPKLMALAVAVLNPGGHMLVTSNYSELSHADLERMLGKGLNGRKVKNIQRVGQDEDFAGTNSFKESYLVGLWVKFN